MRLPSRRLSSSFVDYTDSGESVTISKFFFSFPFIWRIIREQQQRRTRRRRRELLQRGSVQIAFRFRISLLLWPRGDLESISLWRLLPSARTSDGSLASLPKGGCWNQLTDTIFLWNVSRAAASAAAQQVKVGGKKKKKKMRCKQLRSLTRVPFSIAIMTRFESTGPYRQIRGRGCSMATYRRRTMAITRFNYIHRVAAPWLADRLAGPTMSVVSSPACCPAENNTVNPERKKKEKKNKYRARSAMRKEKNTETVSNFKEDEGGRKKKLTQHTKKRNTTTARDPDANSFHSLMRQQKNWEGRRWRKPFLLETRGRKKKLPAIIILDHDQI